MDTNNLLPSGGHVAQWGSAEEALANTEGWCVSDTSDGFCEIQRIDENETFTSDADAIAHVFWMAGTGSALHRKALAWCLRDGNRWPYSGAKRVNGSEAREVALYRTAVSVMASLAAAISLLEGGGKKAAPSDRMFDTMLSDYRKALSSARELLNSPALRNLQDRVMPGQHLLKGLLATDFRVEWEIDAFNASTAREAAQEAFASMQRVGTKATAFTVLGNDGSTTFIDLSESDDQ